MSPDTDVAAKEVLSGLRAALDPDPDRAARKYALLRRKLVSFFEWGGASSPDACADEALVAVAWKMTDGQSAQNVSASCLAIARTILIKKLSAEPPPAGTDGAPKPAEADPFSELEPLLHSFETGLDELPVDSRDLVLTYYSGEHARALEAREALARRINLPLNQMRIRAHRTRSQLEQSVMELAEQSSGGTK